MIKFSELPFPVDSGDHMGVYEIIFDDKYFYIGGSVSIRHRLGQWKHHIKNNKPKSKNILNILPGCKRVRFEILEYVYCTKDVKIIEDSYLKMNWGNPFMLNKCPSAFNNLGIKRTIDEKNSLKTRKGVKWSDEQRRKCTLKRIESGKCKRVGKYSLDGEFISKYYSINAAAKSESVKPRTLNNIFKGNVKKTRNVTFRLLDENDNPIAPITKIKKKNGRKKGFHLSDEHKNYLNRKIKPVMLKMAHEKPYLFNRGTPPKKIIMYDRNGNLIKIHDSVTKAAKEIGTGSGNICRVLKKKRKYALGYYFEYLN